MVAQVDRHYVRLRPSKIFSRLLSYVAFEGRPVTTRGQWINPIVFANLAFAKNILPKRKVDRPIFIVGTGRSGTTILGILLSMHRDVGFLNEPKAMWHVIYRHEDVIGSYSRERGNYRLNSSDVDEQIRDDAHNLFGGYLTATRSTRLVDKYPELLFRVDFVRAIFPDAKFIFLTRNGWDTCASIEKWSMRLGKQKNGEIHDWWGVNGRKWQLLVEELVKPDEYFADMLKDIEGITRHEDMAALEWVVTMREGLKREIEMPSGYLRVRYEDLVDNPRNALSDILEFAELKADESVITYAEKVVRPAPTHEGFALHPGIQPLFDETMSQLGYS